MASLLRDAAPIQKGARTPIPAALVGEFQDICGRIAELIDLFEEADTVLAATLEETLTREALGLSPQRADGR